MAGESITFDFVGRGADSLAQDFKKTGDNATLAAKGARLCADALDKQRKAADVSAGATIALAKADKILEDAEHGLADGALEAEFALKKQADAAKEAAVESAAAGVAAEGAGGGFSGLASPMGAAVAAGVALAPVLLTVGTGLGGLGLAALAVSKNTKLMSTELAPLKSQFNQFSKSLQPEILTLFGEGVQVAGHFLHDIQPVAASTGKALGLVLGQIDKEFQSGTWQQFFGFMAKTAGPDIQLLGNLFTQLAADLPPLLEQLQPVAEGLLKDADAALKLVNAGTQLVAWEKQQAKSVSDNTGLLGRFGHAAEQAFEQMFPGVKAAGQLKDALDKAGTSTDSTGRKIQGLGVNAGAAAVHVQSLESQVNGLTDAENKALSPLLAYSNSLIAQRNDAKSLSDALTTSHDKIGLNTSAQRASFSAANTYIQDLLNTASAAVKSHQGIDAQIRSIQGALPQLQNVKGGTKAYWQEVSTLVGWLNRLKSIKAINEAIHVSGTGIWTVTPGKIGLPGGSAGGPFASGGQVTGGTPGRDSVFGMLMPGEVVVPTNMVRAGAVDHLRGSLPGFASGGVVGSYGPGSVGGLPRWAAKETNATVSAVARSTAAALVAGIKSAQSAASAGAVGALGGPTSASAAQAQSYAASRLGAYGWSSAQMKFLISLWNQESGWNRLARNPSSGAYGIPQALPASKMGAAANPPTSSAAAQINWGLGYIRGRYGSPQSAWSHELSFNWYKHGGLVPGYASGGSVSRQGAEYLKAWQTRHGAGAHGPVVINEQIARLTAAAARAKALAGAKGLSPGQHRFWASSAASEKKRLGVLHKELTTERSWRYQLGLNELGLDKEIKAAGNLPALAGPVKGWKAQLGRDKAKVTAISKMLGYSNAYLAAHKPAPKPPKVTPPGVPGSIPHTGGYTDSTADLIAQLFAASASLSRVVTLDSGGWLMPGVQAVANKTGRPEQVLPPGRGGRGGGHTYNFSFPNYVGSRDDLVRVLSDLKRQGRLPK